MARVQSGQTAPTCRVVRSVTTYQGKQGPTYAGGVSAESVGARAIWLGMIHIPAGVPHVAVNRSQTEPLIVLGARTDPNEQESVVLQPELDALVPAAAP